MQTQIELNHLIIDICYSDKNKGLLLEKQSSNSHNINITNDIFIILVYRIITEITADRNIYRYK